jgi:hypothetical protein
MNVQHSRRSILGTFAAAFAAAPVTVQALTPLPTPATQPLKAPITPDQYIEEMLAIGWEPYAIVQTFRSGKKILLKGTFESCPSDSRPTDEQHLRRFQLQRAVGESGIDFYERTGARLFELGMVQYHD